MRGEERHERENRWKMLALVPILAVVAVVAFIWTRGRSKDDELATIERNKVLVEKLKLREASRAKG